MTVAVRESIVLRSDVPLGAYPERVGDDLVRWAARAPERVFLAERRESGWRSLTYAQALAHARRAGAGLLARGGAGGAPLAILAENGLDHAIAALAALYAGVPFSSISTGYGRADADPARLRAILDTLEPRAIFVPDAAAAARIAATCPHLERIADHTELDGDEATADAAFARIGGDTVAKIVFTSGSTGAPKGVITTHRMLCANQAMLELAWGEYIADPVMVDWMPWSHVASGNKIFGMILHHGGTMYVDEGRPLGDQFAATLRNLREIAPTVYVTVPRGHALLAEVLRGDTALAATFFSRLRLLFNAGASLAPSVRLALSRLAREHGGRDVPILSPYGATETAPMATAVWGTHPPDAVTIGTPVPGVEAKLAPLGDRFEIRLRGPNVTPGYWRNAAATAAAFDEEGYYRTGDAGELADPADPARGIVFRGRLAENFKLSTSTWVNVGALRIALLEAAGGLFEDVVLAGEDRDDVRALVFVEPRAAGALAGRGGGDRAELARSAAVREAATFALRAHNAANPGSSTRIGRLLLLPDGPRLGDGELTDKGTVNQRRALAVRAADVERLYADSADADVLVLP